MGCEETCREIAEQQNRQGYRNLNTVPLTRLANCTGSRRSADSSTDCCWCQLSLTLWPNWTTTLLNLILNPCGGPASSYVKWPQEYTHIPKLTCKTYPDNNNKTGSTYSLHTPFTALCPLGHATKRNTVIKKHTHTQSVSFMKRKQNEILGYFGIHQYFSSSDFFAATNKMYTCSWLLVNKTKHKYCFSHQQWDRGGNPYRSSPQWIIFCVLHSACWRLAGNATIFFLTISCSKTETLSRWLCF